jgi:hypothetical protein
MNQRGVAKVITTAAGVASRMISACFIATPGVKNASIPAIFA